MLIRIQSLFLWVFIAGMLLQHCGAAGAQNIQYVDGLRALTYCWPNWPHLTSAIWAGVAVKPASNCQATTDTPPDLQAIMAWSKGETATLELLIKVQPTWRQAAFQWRNTPSEQSIPSQFVTVLTLWAWQAGELGQAQALARQALASPEAAIVAERLVHGLWGRAMLTDDVSVLLRLLPDMAHAAPANPLIYHMWFETAFPHRDWVAAEQACAGLRQSATRAFALWADLCLGRLAYGQRAFQTAYQAFRVAQQQHPQEARVLFWLGRSAFQIKRPAEATDWLIKGIELTDNAGLLLGLYWNLGDSWRMLGQIEKARVAYEAALRYDLNGVNQIRLRAELDSLVIATPSP